MQDQHTTKSQDNKSGWSKLWPVRIFAIVLAPIALYLTVGGAQLAWLGGSLYYLAAGIVLLAVIALLWRGARLGAQLFTGLVAFTWLWAFWEAGLNGWALLPRVVAPSVLGLWLLTPWVRRALGCSRQGNGVAAGQSVSNGGKAYGLGAVAVVGIVALVWVLSRGPAAPEGPAAPATGQTDWRSWGGVPGGDRHSAAAQLTPANVGSLRVAWRFETGDTIGAEGASALGFEATPLKVGDRLYVCSPRNIVTALDPVTGKTIWRYDPKVDEQGLPFAACRGVAYHEATDAAPDAECRARILMGTVDARLLAIDAATGRPCSNFGANGGVDLRVGLGQVGKGYYYMTSPPTVSGNVAVVGSFILDGQHVDEPSGVIRGYNLTTGKLTWAWDAARPDIRDWPPAGQTYTRGTPNSWGVSSTDEALGLVYVPLGVATPDFYAPNRRGAADRFSNSIVALDNKTGQLRWHFQVVHHDLWDYDVSAQPVLTDYQVGDRKVPALISISKSGQMYVLDRATGKPLTRVIEKPVPQGAAPGDHVSPTQPFSVDWPSFGGFTASEKSMWGVTPLDQLWCRIEFKKMRYDGPFTPPGEQGIVQTPGFAGGVNWGSVSIDPVRRLALVNHSIVPSYVKLISRDEAKRRGMSAAGSTTAKVSAESVRQGVPQDGLRYGALSGAFVSPLKVPCAQPPFGFIEAVSLDTRKVLWRQAIGKADRIGPWGIPSMLPATIGLPTLGGSLTTAGGLTFIASTPDRRLNAYETATGKHLWSGDLPADGNANPMTYVGKDGRQYIVIAAGGSSALNENRKNVLVAFAVPERR